MSIAVTCGECGTEFIVPSKYAGKNFKCRQCGAPLRAGVSVSVSRQWVESDDRSLQQTRSGFTLLFWGSIAALLGLFFVMMSPFIMRLLPMMAGLTATVSILALGMSMTLIGLMRCLAVPASSGARGLIVTAVLCNFFGLLQTLADIFAPGSISQFLGLLLVLCGPVGIVSLILFMNRLSNFIERPDLASRARVLIWAGVAFVGFAVFMIFMMTIAPPLRRMVAVIVPIIWASGLLVFVMFVSLTRSMGNALRT